MTRLRIYLRLFRWKWNKKRFAKLPIRQQEDDFIDFDGRPSLDWMEKEWNSRFG